MQKKMTFCALICLLLYYQAGSQQVSEIQNLKETISGYTVDLDHRLDQLSKQIDDVLWHENTGDVAFIDKLFIYGPPVKKEKNPTAMGAGNPVKFWTEISTNFAFGSYLFFSS